MSMLIENKASLDNGRSVHFMDNSWKKTVNWKVYIGFACGPNGQKRKLCLKVPTDRYLSEEDCDNEITKFETLSGITKKFNDIVSPCHQVSVLVPEKAIIIRTAAIHNLKGRTRSLSRDEWILVLEKIDVPLKILAKRDGTKCRCDCLEAFIHFVHHFTQGDLAISKFRGVEKDSSFILSCPAVHSVDQRFGATDKGTAGIYNILENHTCNSLCIGLGTLPASISLQPSAPPQDDPEVEDDVFEPEGLTTQFKLYFASPFNYVVPFEFTPPPCIQMSETEPKLQHPCICRTHSFPDQQLLSGSCVVSKTDRSKGLTKDGRCVSETTPASEHISQLFYQRSVSYASYGQYGHQAPSTGIRPPLLTSLPPPYSSQCPVGHHIAAFGGRVQKDTSPIDETCEFLNVRDTSPCDHSDFHV